MPEGFVTRRGTAGTVLGSILALIVGALLPYALIVEISALMPVLALSALLTVGLYAWFGLPAAVALNVSFHWVMFDAFGPAGILIGLVSTLPLFFSVRYGLIKREPFFDQMERGVMVSILAIAGAVSVAYLFWGSQIISGFMENIRQQFAAVPDDMLRVALLYTGADTSSLTSEDLRALYDQLIAVAEEQYLLLLPGNLLSGAALSAVLTVTWSNLRMARRGLATPESYIPLRMWHLPARVSIGLLAALLTAYLFSGSLSIGATALNAVYTLALLAFAIQTLSSFARRLERAHARPGGRKFMLTIVILVPLMFSMGIVILVYGAASALFGTYGPFRRKPEAEDGSDQQNGNNQ